MRQIRPIIIILLALAACFTATPKAQAQSVAVKTNLLYDATLTPNLGVEMGLGKRVTAQLFYGLNPWKFSEGKSMRHWQLMGEGRYWFCSKFNGHFLGVHAMGGQFNMAKVNARLYTINLNPAKRNVLDLKNETCKNREKRNVQKISHTRHFKAIKKQSVLGCFYSF